MFGKNGQKGFFRSRVSILGQPPRTKGLLFCLLSHHSTSGIVATLLWFK